MPQRIKTTDKLVSILKERGGEYSTTVAEWLKELGCPRFSFYYALDKLAGRDILEYNKRWEASDPDATPFMIYTAWLTKREKGE